MPFPKYSPASQYSRWSQEKVRETFQPFKVTFKTIGKYCSVHIKLVKRLLFSSQNRHKTTLSTANHRLGGFPAVSISLNNQSIETLRSFIFEETSRICSVRPLLPKKQCYARNVRGQCEIHIDTHMIHLSELFTLLSITH